MRRREFLSSVVATATAWPLEARAQASSVRFILWVSTEAQPDPFIAAFREAMRGRGYLEGQNLAFVMRYAPGAKAQRRLPSMFGWREYCDIGGIASYGANQRATYARLAV